jgi:hypothetical protein
LAFTGNNRGSSETNDSSDLFADCGVVLERLGAVQHDGNTLTSVDVDEKFLGPADLIKGNNGDVRGIIGSFTERGK